jgi:ferredoxin-NADP reductase
VRVRLYFYHTEDNMNHHHHHHTEKEMPFREKMEKLLQHWIKHNIDHAKTYREWKEKAEKEDLIKVADILEEAAETTTQLNEKFEQALGEIS